MTLLGLTRTGTGPPLLWLHGFTQTRQAAAEFRSILAGTFTVLTIDLPGHGENATAALTLPETAAALAPLLPAEIVVGGYSLGGRVALHLALHCPERIRSLVTLGASPGLSSRAERVARQLDDEERARTIETAGVGAFLDTWLEQPLFRKLTKAQSERDCRTTDAAGLASSLRLAGTGSQENLLPRLSQLPMPFLALAGALDEKFCHNAQAMAETAPHGHTAIISGAGHAAHLERPADTARAIFDFLGVEN